MSLNSLLKAKSLGSALKNHPKQTIILASGILGLVSYTKKVRNFKWMKFFLSVGSSILNGIFKYYYYRDILPFCLKELGSNKNLSSKIPAIVKSTPLIKKETILAGLLEIVPIVGAVYGFKYW